MTRHDTGSFQKFRGPAVYTGTAVVGLCWAYIAQGGSRMVIGLYERGSGRISAIVFLMIVPLAGLALSVGIPIWFQRNGRTWLALTTVITSIVLLGWAVLSFFQTAGI